MGAAKAVLVSDDALKGSDALTCSDEQVERLLQRAVAISVHACFALGDAFSLAHPTAKVNHTIPRIHAFVCRITRLLRGDR